MSENLYFQMIMTVYNIIIGLILLCQLISLVISAHTNVCACHVLTHGASPYTERGSRRKKMMYIEETLIDLQWNTKNYTSVN